MRKQGLFNPTWYQILEYFSKNQPPLSSLSPKHLFLLPCTNPHSLSFSFCPFLTNVSYLRPSPTNYYLLHHPHTKSDSITPWFAFVLHTKINPTKIFSHKLLLSVLHKLLPFSSFFLLFFFLCIFIFLCSTMADKNKSSFHPAMTITNIQNHVPNLVSFAYYPLQGVSCSSSHHSTFLLLFFHCDYC